MCVSLMKGRQACVRMKTMQLLSVPVQKVCCVTLKKNHSSIHGPSIHLSVLSISSCIKSLFRLFIYVSTHLLLSQYEDSSWFDGMPCSQSLPSTFHLPPLVGLPHPIPQGPAYADVLPLILWQGQRQLRHLQVRECKGGSFNLLLFTFQLYCVSCV